MEVFSFWKNTHIAQPDSSVNFGPNACSSRGGTNQGLCVIHGMSVIDFSHIYISQMIQPHAKPSACLQADFGEQEVSTAVSGPSLESSWGVGPHWMLRGPGGACLPVFNV